MWNFKAHIRLHFMKFKYKNYLCIHSNKLELMFIGFLSLTCLLWPIFTWIEKDFFLKQIIFLENGGGEGDNVFQNAKNLQKWGNTPTPHPPPPPLKNPRLLIWGRCLAVNMCNYDCSLFIVYLVFIVLDDNSSRREQLESWWL